MRTCDECLGCWRWGRTVGSAGATSNQISIRPAPRRGLCRGRWGTHGWAEQAAAGPPWASLLVAWWTLCRAVVLPGTMGVPSQTKTKLFFRNLNNIPMSYRRVWPQLFWRQVLFQAFRPVAPTTPGRVRRGRDPSPRFHPIRTYTIASEKN